MTLAALAAAAGEGTIATLTAVALARGDGPAQSACAAHGVRAVHEQFAATTDRAARIRWLTVVAQQPTMPVLDLVGQVASSDDRLSVQRAAAAVRGLPVAAIEALADVEDFKLTALLLVTQSHRPAAAVARAVRNLANVPDLKIVDPRLLIDALAHESSFLKTFLAMSAATSDPSLPAATAKTLATLQERLVNSAAGDMASWSAETLAAAIGALEGWPRPQGVAIATLAGRQPDHPVVLACHAQAREQMAAGTIDRWVAVVAGCDPTLPDNIPLVATMAGRASKDDLDQFAASCLDTHRDAVPLHATLVAGAARRSLKLRAYHVLDAGQIARLLGHLHDTELCDLTDAVAAGLMPPDPPAVLAAAAPAHRDAIHTALAANGWAAEEPTDAETLDGLQPLSEHHLKHYLTPGMVAAFLDAAGGNPDTISVALDMLHRSGTQMTLGHAAAAAAAITS